ncbi:unnamed protein product [Hymenolepis diminuta]|uniref:Protein kinase domain-containing protein n=1 Tax=Hymenolepis diminuta TaxID=6216 RepID=A0A0R3SYK8_HYMDI|nr:unnamed protein product [Hymenolepis diminuta]
MGSNEKPVPRFSYQAAIPVCHDSMLFVLKILFTFSPSLLHYLINGSGRHLTLRPLIDMIGEIASGMAYLERECCIHRDSAGQNIHVERNNPVKIAEFGSYGSGGTL